jgi:ketosteroid isomerase-like protein
MNSRKISAAGLPSARHDVYPFDYPGDDATGRAQIAQVWAPYFAGPRAPFSWSPDDVQVLPDGKLALSTGPMLQQ